MPDDLNFERAEYTFSPTILPPEAPVPEYYRADAHIVIGYVALGVGYLVGKAMMYGSGNRGGRNYQIAAAILTYLSISMTPPLALLWKVHVDPRVNFGTLSAWNAFRLIRYGILSPLYGLRHGVGGIITLFILFIAIRAAWRLTSANANTTHHPFSAS